VLDWQSDGMFLKADERRVLTRRVTR